MWKPRIKGWADRFFWALVGAAGIGFFALFGRVAWVAVGLNIEQLMEQEGWDSALALAWPRFVAWVLENTMWLSLAVAFLIGAAVCLAIYRALLPLDKPPPPPDVRAIGQEMGELSADMFQFLAHRTAENAARHVARGKADPADISSWQADRDYEATTSAQFFARYNARAMGALGRLKSLGVSLPPHLVVTAQYGRPNVIAQFLALMGDLLARNDLAQAIEISNDRDFMWQIQH